MSEHPALAPVPRARPRAAAARRPRRRLRPGRPRRRRPAPSTLVRDRRGRAAPACCSRWPAGWCPDASSHLVVLGPPAAPATARRCSARSALAGFAGIDELDDSVTVGAARPGAARVAVPVVPADASAGPADGRRGPRPGLRRPAACPPRRPSSGTSTRSTPCCCGSRWRWPRRRGLLVVDDLDQVHDPARRRLVWDRLDALTADGRDRRRRQCGRRRDRPHRWTLPVTPPP